jgi:hypothetical protein
MTEIRAETAGAAAGATMWLCSCGQEYRVASTSEGQRLWPRNSVDGYCRQGLPPGAVCVHCSRGLPLLRL